jgi:hypothetical protein
MESKQKLKKAIPISSKPETVSAEVLQKQLMELQQQQIEKLTKTIENIEEEHKVGIGVQLDINKLTDVIAYMINNNKPVISLKFEVWKT